ERSLMQTAGRAARNVRGSVILYADEITKSMQKVIDETNRRRKIQAEYNKKHNITPETIYKTVDEVLISTSVADVRIQPVVREKRKFKYVSAMEREELIEQLEREMNEAAKNLAFEQAAEIRDEIERLKKMAK
ncbi:excinuclease ABC subunit B, partial [bacterium SM23_31]